MNSFRFYYEQNSYLRWCCGANRLRVLLLGSPLPAAARPMPTKLALQYSMPMLEPMTSAEVILRIGDFVISEAGDPHLSGHPDIRY